MSPSSTPRSRRPRRAGAVAVSFILVFPIFLIIVAILVQFALLVNARVAVQQAAESAARSAMTALPDDQPEAVRRAARFALVPLSPQAQGTADSEAQATAEALARCGVDVPPTFASRYTYAKDATRVSWTGGDFARSAGREISVTVRYRFQLTVPGAAGILAWGMDTVGGVRGRFIEVGATARVQASHGRQARAHGDGWPR